MFLTAVRLNNCIKKPGAITGLGFLRIVRKLLTTHLSALQENALRVFFCLNRWNNPNFQFRLNLLVQVNFDCVQSQFFQDTIQADLLRRECNVVLLESANDLSRANATVQVTFVISIGFDRDTLLGNQICLLYTSPSPRDGLLSRMPSSA